MFEYVRDDIKRQYGARSRGFIKSVLLGLNSYSLQALLVYRFGRYLMQCRQHRLMNLPAYLFFPVYYALALLMQLLYDIRLYLSADIGPGLYIGHFGGISVRRCIIGSNCSIHQEVCIDAMPDQSSGPAIGNNVWIGAHAKVIGPVRIAEGSTIGAGAVVTQDVPAHQCLVLGNPARVAQRGFDNRPIQLNGLEQKAESPDTKKLKLIGIPPCKIPKS
jgi:serine O-acetyltransferase